MTNRTIRATSLAIALAAALGAAGPTWAAPVLSMTTAVKDAAPSAASDVRYYRGRYHRNDGGAVALGILGAVGAVAAASAYNRGPYYQPQGYYYGGGPQYGYGPGAGYYGYPQYYGNHQSY